MRHGGDPDQCPRRVSCALCRADDRCRDRRRRDRDHRPARLGDRWRGQLAAAAGTPSGNTRTGIGAGEWNPESIRANAGTLKIDTKADVAKVTPLDYKGKLSVWYTGPDASTPQIAIDYRQAVLGGLESRPIRASR